jgi:hypothetical protein
MRIFTSLMFCLLITFMASAQKKLKMDVTKNGDTIYSTQEERLYVKAGATKSRGEHLKCSIYKTNQKYRLYFFVETGRTSVFTIGSGAAAEITLSDGTVVTIYSVSNAQSKVSAIAYGAWLYCSYELDRNSRQLLKDSKVTAIRINASMGPMDYEIKDKFSEVIGEQLEKFN